MVVKEVRTKFKLSIVALMSVVFYAAVLLITNGHSKAFAIVCPVDKDGVPITSGFGSRDLPGHSSYHDGLDLGADYGAPVYATDSGTVNVTENGSSGYGREIDLTPDPNPDARNEPDKTYLYGHLSQINVADGQHVNAGDPIGAVGSTGSSTGAHLHFGENGDNPTGDYVNCTPPGDVPATPAPQPPPAPEPPPAPTPDPAPTPVPQVVRPAAQPVSVDDYLNCLSTSPPDKCDNMFAPVAAPSSYCPYTDHTEYCDQFGMPSPGANTTVNNVIATFFGGGPDCANNPDLERCAGYVANVSTAPAVTNLGNVNTAYPTCSTEQFVYLGDGSGQCETHLKNALKADGYDPNQTNNGVDAVQQYQFDNHVQDSGCDFSKGPETCDGVVGPRTAAALNGDASCCSDGYHPAPTNCAYVVSNPEDICGDPKDPNEPLTPSPYGGDYCDTHHDPEACPSQGPIYDESTFSYGGDYCDTHHDPGACPTQGPIYDESTFSYGGDYCDTHTDPGACPTQDPNYGSVNLATPNQPVYDESTFSYGGDYCDTHTDPEACPTQAASQESGYVGQCEYTDHPEYCDGATAEPGYEGGYAPVYDESTFSYGGDYCDTTYDPGACPTQAASNGEPGYEGNYESSYEGGYAPVYDESTFSYGGDYCDNNPSDCGGGESGYENGYEGGYGGQCEYQDHPEYCE